MRRLLFAFLWVLLSAGIGFAQNNSALTPQALPGLNLQVRGGTILLGTSSTGISTQSVALTNNATNYVFLTTAGVIQTNTTGFTGTVLQIATVVTAQGQIVSIQDNRPDFIFNGSGLPPGPTSPNGVAQNLTSTPSGGVAGAVVYSLPGIVTRAPTGATDTILSTDCNPGRVSYQGSVAVAVTLPTATTLAVPNCVFRLSNDTNGIGTNVTVTPTTWTFVNWNGVLGQHQTVTIGVDPSGTKWSADLNGPNGPSLTYLSSGAQQIPATPAANTTYILSDTTANYTQNAAIAVSNAFVTIQCLDPKVTIQFTGATDGFDVTGNNFTLRGCTLDHNSNTGAGTGPLVTFGTSGTAANDGLIENNIIQNPGLSAAFQGTILIQNGVRNQIIRNVYTSTETDYCVSIFPLNAKSTENTIIAYNHIEAFNAGATAEACIWAQDSNGGGASITGLRVEHNTLYGQGSNANLLQVQGTSVSQTASSPRNVSVSFNNIFYTGTVSLGVKLFTFLNSRFIGNVIDDKTFGSQNLVSLGDTYNSSFEGNTLRDTGSSGAPWLSVDEQGNSTVGNQIFGVPAATPGFEWVSQSGPLSNNSVTSNSVQLTSAIAGICYQILDNSTSFIADGNVFASNNCAGTGTAGQEALDIKDALATGAVSILVTNVTGNVFFNVPTGIHVTATAQTGAGPFTVNGLVIVGNTFETITTGVLINPPNSSGGGAVNVSGVSMSANFFKGVTTGYSSTPGTGNSVTSTQIGQEQFTGTYPGWTLGGTTERAFVKSVTGSGALNNASPSVLAVTLTGPDVFTSSTSYFCAVNEQTTAANGLKVTYASGTSFTITGPNTVTDTVQYVCTGF